MKRAADALELIDRPLDDPAQLDRNLADLALANRWFGGIAPIRRELRRCGARSLLDVGTGRADVPFALIRDAERRGIELRATCLDHSESILAAARRRHGADARMTFCQGDAEALPFVDGAFDAAISTLTLHHLEPEAAIRMLRELRRVARLTPIVGDLVRSHAAYAATWVFAHLCAGGELSRHDGPLSVRRAYTPREALELARRAGWRAPRARREPFFRLTLVDG